MAAQYEIRNLRQQVNVLKEVNAKYQKSAEVIESRLNYFSDKTQKLAAYVGVDIPRERSDRSEPAEGIT
ncbi:MAG: hypothetical protein MZV63_30735 [Marinilabiliales bacterium]|nr:hypothetical protein [Marinilabiliales bacterium]